jgi:phage terminase small subunit
MSVKPTTKQAKALQLIREGKRPVAAMREAGYSAETSRTPGKNLLGSAAAKSVIEEYKAEYLKVGITPQYMAKKTAEWLEAVKVSSSLTEPDRIVPDYQTQVKAAEMVRKDWGLGTSETPGGINANVNIVVAWTDNSKP